MTIFELDEQIEAYESALIAGRASLDDVVRFLPAYDATNYAVTLVEMLRITLEHQWQSGQTDALATYGERFPEIFANPTLLAPLAYEEYRLRAAEGQSVDRSKYAEQYGVDVSSWQELRPESAVNSSDSESRSDTSASWTEFSQSVPATAAGLAVGRRRLPSAGERFGPFHLVALLGQGAFGKVFLARQSTLADRPVALKVTAGPTMEADRLARMQHGNIVPIYSVHRRRRLSAVCMPYLGGVTLADLIDTLKTHKRLPHSAESLVATVAARQAELSTVMAPVEPPLVTDADVRQVQQSDQALARLAARPLEEAIVWIITRVAAGLAHAHQRGIVHRDLKPANILISDDGEPLILDFNLATDPSPAAGHMARLGGTLPYMAPEQLEAFRTGQDQVTPASDVYSLGIVMFECLTRQHPFPIRQGALEAVVGQMIDDRRTLPASVRKLNPAVSPGLAAIVAKCLEPAARSRYQNAAELHEDVRRHLENLPLRHARDISIVERSRKWCRRHPRLSSATSIALATTFIAAIAGASWLKREGEYAQQKAEEQFRKFHAAVPEARALLIVSGPQSTEEQEGLEDARNLLAPYNALLDPAWQNAPSVWRLTAPSRKQLIADVSDLRFLTARRDRGNSSSAASDDTAASDVKEATAATRLLLETIEKSRRGERVAAQQLAKEVALRPSDVTDWLALADCQRLVGDLASSEQSCTAAIALRPELYLPWYHRGHLRLIQKRPQEAEGDFDVALSLRPKIPGGWANRGLARAEQGKHQSAIDDLTQAIDHGVEEPVVYFARARCYEALGKKDQAERDWEEGLGHPPHDPRSWFERGMVNLRRGKYEAAAIDFRQASDLLPSYIDALRNLAHVQSEKLDKQKEGIETQTRILDWKTDDVAALVARGVLYARLGEASQAVADATAVLKLNPPPLAIYQVACIYALLGKDSPQMKSMALAYMQRAIQLQPSILKIACDDPDLKNLHEEQQFQRWLAALDGKKTTE